MTEPLSIVTLLPAMETRFSGHPLV